MDKAFLISYRNTRADNPIQYKLVYAQTEEEAVEKLCQHVERQPYGDMGAKCSALDIHVQTIL
jgi:hypothetical protein